MGKQCLICGENGFLYYPFCKRHLDMKSEGKIIKCENCGKWHLADEKCECQKQQNNTAKPQKTNEHEKKYTELPTSGFDKCVSCGEKTNGYAFCKKCWSNLSEEEMLEILNKEPDPKAEKDIEDENTIKCLLCGEDSDGKHFCKACYKKYASKAITVIINKCREAEIVDEYGNRKCKTRNGLYVRSQQEKIIFDELFNRNIRVEYERTLYLKDENGETQELHPDFYLTDYKLYIEHWGYESTNDKNYLRTKEYKLNLYKLNGCKIAGTSSKDIDDIQSAIDRIFAENDIIVN